MKETFKQPQHKLAQWTQVIEACHTFASHWIRNFNNNNKKKTKCFTARALHSSQKHLLACHVPLLEAFWRIITPPEAVNRSAWLLPFSRDSHENCFLSFLLAPKLWGHPWCAGCIDWHYFTALASIIVFSRIVMPLSNTAQVILFSQTGAYMLFNSTCAMMFGKSFSWRCNL